MGTKNRINPDFQTAAENEPSSWLNDMSLPLDPETFKMMVEIYQAAAALRMPTKNPEQHQILMEGSDKVISFTDIPMNRGMLEVNRQCREIGIQNPQAYLVRLMHMSEIFDARDRFGKLIIIDNDGSMSIHESILEAAAVATFHATPDRLGFDIDDVIQRAQALAAENCTES